MEKVNCLGGATPTTGCEKREQCARYLVWRNPKYPEGETITGAGCIDKKHKLFLEVRHVQ